MVGRLALALLVLFAGPGLGAEPVSVTAQVSSVSATAKAPLEPYTPELNHPVEDFFVVTLVSLPFTALWSLVGATVVGAISQDHFPPEFSTDMLIGAGAVALGTSVSIGLVSASWGRGKAPSKNPTPTPTNP